MHAERGPFGSPAEWVVVQYPVMSTDPPICNVAAGSTFICGLPDNPEFICLMP